MKKISFFEQSQVFPRIAKVIEVGCAGSGEFINHDNIARLLQRDPEASKLIEWAAGRAKIENAKSKDWTRDQWADNMVAWFSKEYTEQQSIWQTRSTE